MRSLVVACVLLALIVVPFLIVGERMEEFGSSLVSTRGTPVAVAAVVVGLLALDIALPVPSSIVAVAAGAMLGFGGGLAANFFGMTLGSALGYLAGAAGSSAAQRYVGRNELARALTLMTRFGPWAVLCCRGVPVLAEATALVCGLTGWPVRRFALLSTLSNVAVSAAYAGAGAYAWNSRVALVAFIAVAVIPGSLWWWFGVRMAGGRGGNEKSGPARKSFSGPALRGRSL